MVAEKADGFADLELEWLDDPTFQPVFCGELSDFMDDVENLYTQAAYYFEMKELRASDPSLSTVDLVAHPMPTPRRHLRLFIEKFEKIQASLDACRNAWGVNAWLVMGRRHDEPTEAYNDRLWTNRREAANALIEKLQKIEAACDQASKSTVPPKVRGRKDRCDSPSALLKAKCVALKKLRSKRTWADVRHVIHRDHSHLLPERHRDNPDYPSDESMQRFRRNLEG